MNRFAENRISSAIASPSRVVNGACNNVACFVRPRDARDLSASTAHFSPHCGQ